MCWRDNRRNFALEAAERERNQRDAEERSRAEAWIMGATPAQMRAARSRNILGKLVGIVVAHRGFDMTYPIGPEDYHAHFPAFAQAIGLRGQFYRTTNGLCPAITFYYASRGMEPNPHVVSFVRYSTDDNKTMDEAVELARSLGLGCDEATLLQAAEDFFDAVDEKHRRPRTAT